MLRSFRHAERHAMQRAGWLRAAVLGANDGILSTGSLIVGVAAAAASRADVLTAGLAGLAAGAMSMAAGEYVSVSSQVDVERADLARERAELVTEPEAEHAELGAIYVERGLDPALAAEVARQLMRKDALGAHARDELGISEITSARPVQAALASAASFAIGAMVPLLIAWAAPRPITTPAVVSACLVCLAASGAVAARAGRAPPIRAALRVTFWGALAMAVTGLVGAVFGAVV